MDNDQEYEDMDAITGMVCVMVILFFGALGCVVLVP